jgi:hypothetical protein
MKYRLPVLLALVVALAAPIPADAQNPVREVLPPPPDDTTEACGFPVLVHTVGTTIRKTWFDEQGNPVRAIETYPGLKYVLTNLETQKQIQFSIVGPAFYEFRPDGSFTVTGTGPWGWYPENPETGEPGIFLIRGRLTFTVDAEGNLVSFDVIVGHVVNVCSRLA